PPPRLHLLLDRLVSAAEELRDGLSKGSLVGEAGFQRRDAEPRLVARDLGRRRGAQEIGKLRSAQVRLAAVAAQVVFNWPSVEMHHGEMKNMRRERGGLEREMFRRRKVLGAKEGRKE